LLWDKLESAVRTMTVLGHLGKCAPVSLEAVSGQLVLCVFIIINDGRENKYLTHAMNPFHLRETAFFLLAITSP
jgi:hypothetical protein